MKYDTLIFDMDGVLIDTQNSFSAAVIEAVQFATGEDLFRNEHLQSLKEIRGFNNDWHAATAGAAWLDYASGSLFNSFVEQLDNLGGGLPALREMFPELTREYERKLTRLTQEAYGGSTGCMSLYGFYPEYLNSEGSWRTEKALVDAGQLAAITPYSGIITGRSERELRLGMELLEWLLPDEVVAWSDDPALDKPNPKKLIAVLQSLNAKRPVYLGDTRDDAELVKKYRENTGRDLDFCRIGVERNQIEHDLSYSSVSEFLKKQGIT